MGLCYDSAPELEHVGNREEGLQGPRCSNASAIASVLPGAKAPVLPHYIKFFIK